MQEKLLFLHYTHTKGRERGCSRRDEASRRSKQAFCPSHQCGYHAALCLTREVDLLPHSLQKKQCPCSSPAQLVFSLAELLCLVILFPLVTAI